METMSMRVRFTDKQLTFEYFVDDSEEYGGNDMIKNIHVDVYDEEKLLGLLETDREHLQDVIDSRFGHNLYSTGIEKFLQENNIPYEWHTWVDYPGMPRWEGSFAGEGNCDTIDFTLFDPVEAGEEWAVEEPCRPLCSVKVWINGEEFMEIIRRTEAEKSEKGADTYGHADAGLFADFARIEPGKSWIMPFCCMGCGDLACCTFEGDWRKDKHFVYWENFISYTLKHYGLRYRFEREDYFHKLDELEKAEKSFIEKRKVKQQ